jgi:predicted metal-dependent hydrolase
VVLTLPAGVSRRAAQRFFEQHREWAVRKAAEARLRASQYPQPAEPTPEDFAKAARLRREARAAATRLLDEESARLGLAYAGLRIGDPVSLWGSCAASGRISLSWRLLLAPPEVFRYVVIHELCHLRWRSHGPRFWALVARQMPEFEVHRRWLRVHGAELHAMLPRA